MSEKNARDYTSQLQRAVEGRSVEFNQSHFKRYAREFKTAIDLDKIPPRLLEKAVEYIAEFWDQQQLTVQKSVGGVQSREPVIQTAADRKEGYEHLFELSPRQDMMLALMEKRGNEKVLEMVREHPDELREYLEGKV
jgi:hypothetical protein